MILSTTSNRLKGYSALSCLGNQSPSFHFEWCWTDKELKWRNTKLFTNNLRIHKRKKNEEINKTTTNASKFIAQNIWIVMKKNRYLENQENLDFRRFKVDWITQIIDQFIIKTALHTFHLHLRSKSFETWLFFTFFLHKGRKTFSRLFFKIPRNL